MGIDHHKQYSHITLLDEKGEKLKSGRVTNLRRELEKFLQGIGNVKAVIEAGRSSYTMVDVLDDMGIETAFYKKQPALLPGKCFAAFRAGNISCRKTHGVYE